MADSSLPKKKKLRAAPSSKTTPAAQPPVEPVELGEPSSINPPELIAGLSKVIDRLKNILDHPSEKPVTEEIEAEMEKVHQLSSFLTAVYANMVRIAVEEEGATPQVPNQEQRDFARQMEALSWGVRALQEKVDIQLKRTSPQTQKSSKKRRTQIQRSQGDNRWKKL